MGDGKNANNDKKLTENVILALLSRNSIDLRESKKFGILVVEPTIENIKRNPKSA